ncbi:MAG: hypothetical protein ACRDYC_03865 [Acidimicrobiales bacterium]
MTILAVQNYVQGCVDGLIVPGYPEPLKAFVKAPTPGTATLAQPMAFVWGGMGSQSRTTLPRGPGWKGTDHTVSIWIYGLELANLDPPVSYFPSVLQTIVRALSTAKPMPAQLIDTQTGDPSYLMNLGENITWEYDVDRTMADQRIVRNLCHMEAAALEEFNA